MEKKKGPGGRPRKWIDPKIRSVQLGADDLAVIVRATKITGESLNSFLVHSALDRALEIEAAQRRQALLQDVR